MDINNSSSWDLDIAMEEHILHQQIPSNSLWQSYPLQTHQIPTPPTQASTTSTFPGTDQIGNHVLEEEDEPEEELGAMKEMMYKIAAMQPVDIDPSTIRKPKRRNVRISDDPQSVAARHRRERISEKIRILQRLVPGGTKMDTASMLDEAIRYVKFLKRQIRLLQSNQCIGNWPFTPNKAHGSSGDTTMSAGAAGFGFPVGNGEDGLGYNHEVISGD